MSDRATQVVRQLAAALEELTVEELDARETKCQVELEAGEARVAQLESELRLLRQLKTLKLIEAAEIVARDEVARRLDDRADPSGRQRVILAALIVEEATMTSEQLQRALDQQGLPIARDTLHSLLSRMCKRGLIRRIGRGRYAASNPAEGGS